MPLYDFRCIQCDSREERRVPMGDSDKQRCWKCDGRLVVVIQPTGLSARRSTEGKGHN